MKWLSLHLLRVISVMVLSASAFAITPTVDAYACSGVAEFSQTLDVTAQIEAEDGEDGSLGLTRPCAHGHCHHNAARPALGNVTSGPVFERLVIRPAPDTALTSLVPDKLKRPPRM